MWGLDGFRKAKDAQTWSEAEWSEKAPRKADQKRWKSGPQIEGLPKKEPGTLLPETDQPPSASVYLPRSLRAMWITSGASQTARIRNTLNLLPRVLSFLTK